MLGFGSVVSIPQPQQRVNISLLSSLLVYKPSSSSNTLLFYIPQPINLLSKGCYKDNCINDQVFERLIVG